MDFIISASTDVGIVKETNQDSLFVRTIKTSQGRMVFAVLCDGMGGLSKGEVASAAVITAFTDWMNNSLSVLSDNIIDDLTIHRQWDTIACDQNEKIKEYGRSIGVSLGTTVTALLLTAARYYIMNIGDGRVYEITDSFKQITNDQTVAARDVSDGLITQEQAEEDPRQNVLLQCVGASETVIPDFFYGDTVQNAVYMLCSDGFRHKIKPHEIHSTFHPSKMTNADGMKSQSDALIAINKQRIEEDNISVITVRTF